MNEAALSDADISPRGNDPTRPFCWQGHEVYDIFLPIMGADCFTIYAYFTRGAFRDPKLRHSVRSLADETDIGTTTVSRSLEILAYLGLVKLTRPGGSRESECQLLDSRDAAKRLGAEYHRQSLSFSLPPEVARRLRNEVEALRRKQQGKAPPANLRGAPIACGNSPSCVSQRNASVSLAIRKRPTRETQTGFHLIQEERRIEEVPTPNPPTHDGELEETKTSPSEDEPDEHLKRARIGFIAVMDEMRAHLLDTSRPPNPCYANGAADWQKFGFNSLAVEEAAWHGEALALTLSASNPETARYGLEKYRRIFNSSLRTWYGGEVEIVLVKAHRQTCCGS